MEQPAVALHLRIGPGSVSMEQSAAASHPSNVANTDESGESSPPRPPSAPADSPPIRPPTADENPITSSQSPQASHGDPQAPPLRPPPHAPPPSAARPPPQAPLPPSAHRETSPVTPINTDRMAPTGALVMEDFSSQEPLSPESLRRLAAGSAAQSSQEAPSPRSPQSPTSAPSPQQQHRSPPHADSARLDQSPTILGRQHPLSPSSEGQAPSVPASPTQDQQMIPGSPEGEGLDSLVAKLQFSQVRAGPQASAARPFTPESLSLTQGSAARPATATSANQLSSNAQDSDQPDQLDQEDPVAIAASMYQEEEERQSTPLQQAALQRLRTWDGYRTGQFTANQIIHLVHEMEAARAAAGVPKPLPKRPWASFTCDKVVWIVIILVALWAPMLIAGSLSRPILTDGSGALTTKDGEFVATASVDEHYAFAALQHLPEETLRRIQACTFVHKHAFHRIQVASLVRTAQGNVVIRSSTMAHLKIEPESGGTVRIIFSQDFVGDEIVDLARSLSASSGTTGCTFAVMVATSKT